MLLVKLKNLLTSACLNLNYGAVKQKQKYKGCKCPHKFNFGSFLQLHNPPPPFLLEEN